MNQLLSVFNDEIYPYINNYLEISPMVQNRFKVSDLEIIAYLIIIIKYYPLRNHLSMMALKLKEMSLKRKTKENMMNI